MFYFVDSFGILLAMEVRVDCYIAMCPTFLPYFLLIAASKSEDKR